jgi:hypothetical protein
LAQGSRKRIAVHQAAPKHGYPSCRQLGFLALAGCLGQGVAQAQLHIVPEVAAQAAYDSNVFALSSREQAIVEGGDTRRSDTVYRYLAGASGDYQWDIQKAFAAIEARRVLYQNFDQLNHDEYLLTAGFNWKIGETLDGMLDYRQERSMADFAELQTEQLTMQRERKAGGTFNFIVTPEWRLESGFRNHQLTLPLRDLPDYALSENSVNAAIKYIGIEKLSAGLNLEYLRGSYQGEPVEDKFSQETAELTAKYVVSGLSNIGAKIGYTERQEQATGGDNVSGVAGSLSYIRRLSGKTSVDAELFREVNSYVAGANATVDTGARLGVFWQPTYKIITVARYEFSHSAFQGQGGVNANRSDQYQSVVLNISYQPLRWVYIKPFVRYQDRHSDIAIDGFNECTAGLQIQIRFNDIIGVDDNSELFPGGIYQ